MDKIISKKKKVLFVIPNLGAGGAERVLSLLLEYIKRDKFELSCIVYDSSRVYKIPDDVIVHCLDIPGIDNSLKKTTYAIKRIFRIREIINTEKPDVIFSFISTVNLVVICAWLLSKIKNNVKLIVSIRTYPSMMLKGKLFFFKKLLIKVLYPKADEIIVNSEGMRKDLIDHFRLPEERIDVIYNPLDVSKVISLSEERVEHEWFNDSVPVIINVGSLNKCYQKGQDFLLKTFRRVREKVNSRLVFLGKGEKENELKQLSSDLGVSNDVAFLGFQENPFKFIVKSSVFVLSSRFEGFPNVLLEAMACGVPVVSTRCPSGPEEIITDSIDGLLVPVDDEEKMAEAIIRVLTVPDLSVSLASAAKKAVLWCDVKTTIEKYESVFTRGEGKTEMESYI